VILEQASLEIVDVIENQNLMVYFKTVKANFSKRDDTNQLSVKNTECGINHITSTHELPVVKPLVEIKCALSDED